MESNQITTLYDIAYVKLEKKCETKMKLSKPIIFNWQILIFGPKFHKLRSKGGKVITNFVSLNELRFNNGHANPWNEIQMFDQWKSDTGVLCTTGQSE